jgi:hypothetical protein
MGDSIVGLGLAELEMGMSEVEDLLRSIGTSGDELLVLRLSGNEWSEIDRVSI